MNNDKIRITQPFKWLFLIYIGIIFIRIYYSTWIQNPYWFPDEMIYSSLASSFIESGQFIYKGAASHLVPPLYPILISPAYLAHDMITTYSLVKIINSLVATSIIFPTWLLAKEFMSEKEAILPAVMAGVLPEIVYSNMLLTENLFFPLTIFCMYMIYKSLTEDNKKTDIICGIFIGLSYLAKIFGVFIFLTFVLGIVFKVKEKTIRLRIEEIIRTIVQKKLVFIAALLTVMPWIIRNALLFGFTSKGVVGPYSSVPVRAIAMATGEASIPIRKYIFFTLSHTSYLAIASGVVFFIGCILLMLLLSEKKLVHEKFENLRLLTILTWVSIILYVLYSTYHGGNDPGGSYRVQGRYIDAVLPLILITGYISLKYINENYDKYKITKLVEATILTSAILMFAPFSFLRGPAPIVSPDIIFLHIFKDFTTELFSSLFFVVFPFIFIILYKFKLLNLRYISILFILFLLFSGYFTFIQHVVGSRVPAPEAEPGKWVLTNGTKNAVLLIEAKNQQWRINYDFLELQTQFWLRGKAKYGEIYEYRRFIFVPNSSILDIDSSTQENYMLISNISGINYTWIPESGINAGKTNYSNLLFNSYINGTGENKVKIRVPNNTYNGSIIIMSNHSTNGTMNLSINGNEVIDNLKIVKEHFTEKGFQTNVTDGFIELKFDGNWVISSMVLENLNVEKYDADYLLTTDALNLPKVFSNNYLNIYYLK